nr:putative nitronate monooxygenase [Quercus suber]
MKVTRPSTVQTAQIERELVLYSRSASEKTGVAGRSPASLEAVCDILYLSALSPQPSPVSVPDHHRIYISTTTTIIVSHQVSPSWQLLVSLPATPRSSEPLDTQVLPCLHPHDRPVVDIDAITEQIRTVTTDLLKINHPIMLAGMNVAAGPKLAAAVSNAGGIGVIGGVGYTPDMLREQIAELKGFLKDKNAPFGVDLLLPQVGGSARKTNYDYTKGKLDELITIIIDSGARLFVSAVGVPPKHVVERLHKAGILYMNMIGHPKHVAKCLDLGVDMICAQGGEGGGHTGDVPTTILIPTVAALCKGKKSPMTGQPVQVIAAGGLFNGQSLAAALALGASAVWIGTRFVLSEEAGAPKAHQEAVRTSGFDDNVRTIIFTGRPLRVRNNPYINNWEVNRQNEIKELTGKGIIPVEHDFEKLGDDIDDDTMDQARPFLMGKAAAVTNERKSAKAIIDEMVSGAVDAISASSSAVIGKSKL